MKVWIHNKLTVIFWVTLAIYALIWVTASYIGVYITYIAAPMLLMSGVLAWLTAPGDEG